MSYSTGYEPKTAHKAARGTRRKGKIRLLDDPSSWPMFKTKFEADVQGIGVRHVKALEDKDPFTGLSYSGVDPSLSQAMITIAQLRNKLDDLELLKHRVKMGVVKHTTLEPYWIQHIHDALGIPWLTDEFSQDDEVPRAQGQEELPSQAGRHTERKHRPKRAAKTAALQKIAPEEADNNKDKDTDEDVSIKADKDADHDDQVGPNAFALTEDNLEAGLTLVEMKWKRDLKEATKEHNLQQEYDDICTLIYSNLIAVIDNEPIKVLANAGVIKGDGIGAWNALLKKYEGSTTVNLRRCFYKLLKNKMEKNSEASLIDYIYEFRQTESLIGMMLQKTAPGAYLPEGLLITILIEGLHPSYKPIVNILNAKAELTLSEVIHQLQVFQESSKPGKPKAKSGNKDKGMMSSECRKGKTKSKKQLMQCFNCGRRHSGGERQCQAPCKLCGKGTHTRYHCPTRKRKNKHGGRQRKGDNDIAAVGKMIENLQTVTNNLQRLNKSHQGDEDEKELSFDFAGAVRGTIGPIEPHFADHLYSVFPLSHTEKDNDSMPDLTSSPSSDDSLPDLVGSGDDSSSSSDSAAEEEKPFDPHYRWQPGDEPLRGPNRWCKHTVEHHREHGLCNCGRVCNFCLSTKPYILARCPRCRNPVIRYCSRYCREQDKFEHYQFCTPRAKEEWKSMFFDWEDAAAAYEDPVDLRCDEKLEDILGPEIHNLNTSEEPHTVPYGIDSIDERLTLFFKERLN